MSAVRGTPIAVGVVWGVAVFTVAYCSVSLALAGEWAVLVASHVLGLAVLGAVVLVARR